MTEGCILTMYNPKGGWDNIEEGKLEPISHHKTKRSAVVKGLKEAKKRNFSYKAYNLNGETDKRFSSRMAEPCEEIAAE